MPLRLALIFLYAVSLTLAVPESRAADAGAHHSALRTPHSANVSVAVLDLGATETGVRATERLRKQLADAGAKGEAKLSLLDRDWGRAAARGIGYRGSLNLTLSEARSLGAAIGCDFYVTGDAQTIRRSSSVRPVYFESYASVFIVSARTGRLVLWDRPRAEADKPERAEASLLEEVDERAARYVAAVREAFAREERERFDPPADEGASLLDLSSDAGAGARTDLREPAPYRRLRPAYPDTASRAEAEATVDVAVEIGADGEVGRVEIVRWAGFGLDDSVVSTIRRMHFRPAERGGQAVAVRVLLRYNFRRPPPTPE
ncbi:MAG TPA: energy transducer TonB [Pyrinomonadaceae bacterium]|jgi:protein TonB|nr:energy transducer TonB [Pyrinomonadaceae bacterium]